MKSKIAISFILLILFTVYSNLNAETIKNNHENRLIIGYSGSPSTVDFWNKLKHSLFARAKELEIVVVDFSGNNFTFKAQESGLKRAVELKIDGMIIGAVSHEIANSIELFKEKNIPVIAVNVPIKNDWIGTTIATNNHKAAEIAGEFLLKSLKKKKDPAKRVVILCGDAVREDALIRTSVPHKILFDAGYDVHDYYAKGWSSKFSLIDAIDEYSNNAKEIAAVFSCYAGASIASVETAETFSSRPIQVGFDMDENMRIMIEEGRLDATVTQDPRLIGIVGIESMLRLLKKDVSLPKSIEIPAQLITRENIKNFY